MKFFVDQYSFMRSYTNN